MPKPSGGGKPENQAFRRGDRIARQTRGLVNQAIFAGPVSVALGADVCVKTQYQLLAVDGEAQTL